MKDFFKTSSFKVLVIVVVVLLGLLIYTATAGGSVVASLLGFVTSPMQSVSTQVTGSVTEFVDLDALSRDELKEMVNSLSQENATLREQLVDYETGEPFTAHTTNPVPFILVNADPSCKLREGGALCDIVPTLIELMGMEQPLSLIHI